MKERIGSPISLKLEVEEIERKGRPGCDASTTRPFCTRPSPITTGCFAEELRGN